MYGTRHYGQPSRVHERTPCNDGYTVSPPTTRKQPNSSPVYRGVTASCLTWMPAAPTSPRFYGSFSNTVRRLRHCAPSWAGPRFRTKPASTFVSLSISLCSSSRSRNATDKRLATPYPSDASLRFVILKTLKISLGVQGASQREVPGCFFGCRGVGWSNSGCAWVAWLRTADLIWTIPVHTIRSIHAVLLLIPGLGK